LGDSTKELRVARIALDEGISVNNTDCNGSTPLHKAANWGKPAMCRFLLSKGANVNAKNNRGNTPLHEAKAVTFMTSEATREKMAACAAILVEAGGVL